MKEKKLKKGHNSHIKLHTSKTPEKNKVMLGLEQHGPVWKTKQSKAKQTNK